MPVAPVASEMQVPAPSGGPVLVQVTHGPLPRGSVLVLRTPGGEIAGSIAPFGLGASVPARMMQPIMVDAGLVQGGVLRLEGWIATETGERPATRAEFIGAVLGPDGRP